MRLVNGICAAWPVARDQPVAPVAGVARYSSTVSVNPSVQSVCQCTVMVVTGSRCQVRYKARGSGGGASGAVAAAFSAGAGVCPGRIDTSTKPQSAAQIQERGA